MYQSMSFTYDDVPGSMMGLLLCKITTQNTEEMFVSNRTPVTDRIQRNDKSQNYLYTIQRDVLKFQADFFCENGLDDTQIRRIAQYFFKGKYCDFIPGDTHRMYNCMPVGQPTVNTNGNSGYFTIQFECSSEYSTSLTQEYTFDFSATADGKTLHLYNDGDVKLYPVIELTMIDATTEFIVENKTTDETFYFDSFTGVDGVDALRNNEVVTFDCDKEIITTNQLGLHRYANMAGDFISLALGDNEITVSGKCIIKFKYKNKYLL